MEEVHGGVKAIVYRGVKQLLRTQEGIFHMQRIMSLVSLGIRPSASVGVLRGIRDVVEIGFKIGIGGFL